MRISVWSSDVCSSDLFARYLISENRDLESVFHAANDVEIGKARLHHHIIGALGEIERDFPQRLLSIGRVHLVALLVALQEAARADRVAEGADRKSTRLNSSHYCASRMPSSA